MNKQFKKCIREKKKDQEGNKKSCKHLKSSEESKNRELQICKGKNPHSEDQKNTKDEVITSRKGIANVFGEFYKKMFDDEIEDKTMRRGSDSEAKHNEEAKKH